MCIAVPMKIIEIYEKCALCEFNGIQRECDVSLICKVNVGDYVLIHSGFAIEKIDDEKALEEIICINEILKEE